jgi:hypothetical protein
MNCRQPTVILDDFSGLLASGQARRVSTGSVLSDERAPEAGAWALQSGIWGAPRGEVLFSGRNQQAPTLTFRPGVVGRFAIVLSLVGKRPFSWPKPGRSYEHDGFGAFVRLAGEPTFTTLLTERNELSFEDVYFRTADLHGDSAIEIANFSLATGLLAIKLYADEPQTQAPPTRRLLGILDFADDVDLCFPRDEAARAAVRRHAQVGFDTVMWKCSNGCTCEYHTAIGRQRDDATPIAQLMRQFDPLQQAADEARRLGVNLYAWFRLMRDPTFKSGQEPPTAFHAANPHMVQVHRDGRESWQLSLAYPEVRRHLVNLMCEPIRLGAGGVFIDLLRHPPVARFDRPLVEAFLQEHGIDPRQLPGDGSEAWLRFRCRPFTQFLRELRAALRLLPGPAPLLVRTMDQPWRNLQAGCDVETWLDEQLLDGLIPAPHLPLGDSYPEQIDLRPFIARAAGRTPIYGQVWRQSSSLLAEALAADFYRQGAAGVVLYESNLAVTRSSLRTRFWRLARP